MAEYDVAILGGKVIDGMGSTLGRGQERRSTAPERSSHRLERGSGMTEAAHT